MASSHAVRPLELMTARLEAARPFKTQTPIYEFFPQPVSAVPFHRFSTARVFPQPLGNVLNREIHSGEQIAVGRLVVQVVEFRVGFDKEQRTIPLLVGGS